MKIILLASLSVMVISLKADLKESRFNIYANTFLNSDKTLLKSIQIPEMMFCLSICSQTEDCHLAAIVPLNGTYKCNIHQFNFSDLNAVNFLLKSTLYKKSI